MALHHTTTASLFNLNYLEELDISYNEIYNIPNEIQRLRYPQSSTYPEMASPDPRMFCTSKCDWCHGPRFGEGFRIIRSCDMFGATQIPIMFSVCSPSCYVEIRETSFVLEGFPSRRIALNLDWVKERRVSDVSFYL
ncbi:hypothetical protein U0070_011366 [Myodes glareolus]|uniref:Uncharacterized protein n=1 Tax=Myodes glareolus TaxID=447135 RepID=A0AAW0HXY8_MYOGA